ncbi:MAG: LuxR C-terminal-related transcriptional regulator, partial [candidate division Zixibacteria bacterium]
GSPVNEDVVTSTPNGSVMTESLPKLSLKRPCPELPVTDTSELTDSHSDSAESVTLHSRKNGDGEGPSNEVALRESEELNRIILSNISDTVFITDDDGAFTFICPNVRIIFGLCEDEVGALAHIENLLGPNLFNMEDLKTLGGLTRIERSITHPSEGRRDLLISVKRISVQGGTVLYACHDITESKRNAEALTAERAMLERKNIALKEVLERIDDQKTEAGQQLQANIHRIILPLLSTVIERLSPADRHIANLLENTLTELADPMVNKLEKMLSNLSPRESEVCHMIRNGFSTKQIANTLNISTHTVNNQRQSIRRKLRIVGPETSLMSYLKSL